MENLPSIKKNLFLSTLYQVYSVITPFITAPYISRVLGPVGVGVYSYTSSIQLYFSLFASLGTSAYGMREISRERDNPKKMSKLFWEIESLTIITSLITLVFWGIFVANVKQYQICYIILTMNLFNTMFDISWFYTGIEQLKYTVTKNLVVKTIGIIALFVFIKKTEDLYLYIFLMSLFTLLGTLSMWGSLPKFLVKINKKEISIFVHLKETIVYFIPTIATSIYTVLDKTLIGFITKEAEQNGYYEQASRVINIFKAVTFTSLNTVLGSRISYLFEKNDIEEIKNKIKMSIDFILLFGIGACTGLISVADSFVPIFFGQGYSEVSVLLKWLSPVLVIVGISNCLGSQYYSPAGLRKKSSMYIIIGSIVNLVFNILLIPKFKSFGAVVGTLLAESTITILYFVNCNRFYTIKQFVVSLWKKVIAAVIMYIIILFVSKLLLNDYIVLICEILIGVFVYFFILFLLKDKIIIEFISRVKNRGK